MQKYGRIKDGQFELSSKRYDGFKPVTYAEIPEFDQTTQYVEQTEPVEYEEYILIDVVVKELPEDINEGEQYDEDVL